MRYLSITRTKKFAGCLMAVKIYVSDPTGDTVINNEYCRLLGSIKNGCVGTFEISDGEQRVYAIYDKLSKDYCKDYYTIPAGSDNVEISGSVHLNPAAGNPFYFDGVTDDAVLESRKDGKKMGYVTTIIAVAVGAIIGFLLVALLYW